MGRQREFDPDTALEMALRVFWEKGFERATLPELTEAMGINRPSMYAAFGNKEDLFREVLSRYAEGPASYQRHALDAPTAKAVVENMLSGAVAMLSNPRNPGGCLWVKGALTTEDASQSLRAAISNRRRERVFDLEERLAQAQEEGELPPDLDVASFARYIQATCLGLAVQASTGASREELEAVAAAVLERWPE